MNKCWRRTQEWGCGCHKEGSSQQQKRVTGRRGAPLRDLYMRRQLAQELTACRSAVLSRGGWLCQSGRRAAGRQEIYLYTHMPACSVKIMNHANCPHFSLLQTSPHRRGLRNAGKFLRRVEVAAKCRCAAVQIPSLVTNSQASVSNVFLEIEHVPRRHCGAVLHVRDVHLCKAASEELQAKE